MTLRQRLTRLERTIQAEDDKVSPWLDERPLRPCDPNAPEPTPEQRIEGLRRGIAFYRAKAERFRQHPQAVEWWTRCAERTERQLAKALGEPVGPPGDWLEALQDGMDWDEARALFPS